VITPIFEAIAPIFSKLLFTFHPNDFLFRFVRSCDDVAIKFRAAGVDITVATGIG
jgi:hypothetical protein